MLSPGSTWTLTDEKGDEWIGTLLITDRPAASNGRFAMLRVERPGRRLSWKGMRAMAEQKNITTESISLVGMAGTLALAYGFDRWLESLRVAASRTIVRPLWPLWPSSAANLVLAGCLVTLSWFVTCRSGRSKLVASIFVVVGLLVMLLSFTIGSMVPLFRTGYTGAFILAIGILSLMLIYQGGS